MFKQEDLEDFNKLSSMKEAAGNAAKDITVHEWLAIQYLVEKKGRAMGITVATDTNPKSMWQALQTASRKSLVEKDEFQIYSITEFGKEVLEATKINPRITIRLLAENIALHSYKLPENTLPMLRKLNDQISARSQLRVAVEI